MKDSGGEEVLVEALAQGKLWVSCRSVSGRYEPLFLTPAKARKLVKKINKAIKEIENNG